MNSIGIAPVWTIAWSVTAIFIGLALLSLIGGVIHRAVGLRNIARAKKENQKKLAELPTKSQYERMLYYFDARYSEPFTTPWWVTASVVGGVGVMVLITQLFMMIPYNEKYWSWYETSGVVVSVDPVLTATDGNAIDTDYIVYLDSTETPLRMNDPRIIHLEGENVSLLCGVSWQAYGEAADTWSCDIRTTSYTEDSQ